MESDTTNRCLCDPLKILVNWFLQEPKLKSCLDKPNNCHMFYKSSVMKNKVRNKKLRFRILQDTFRSAQEWQYQINELEKGNSKAYDMELENRLETILKMCETKGGLLISNYKVSAVSSDPFGNISLTLDPHQMAQAFVHWMVTGSKSGLVRNDCHRMKAYKIELGIKNSTDNPSHAQLLDYRKVLVAQSISKTAKMIGYETKSGYFNISDAKIPSNTMFVLGKLSPMVHQTKNPDEFNNHDVVLQLCIGNITVGRENQTETNLSDVLNERLSAIKEIGESRPLSTLGISAWATSAHNLATATLQYDILSKPLEVEIQLPVLETQKMNHDALLIMYNYSRVLSILRRFDEQVQAGDYPNLPSVFDIDFKSIGTKEEELQLLQTVLEWPRILDIVINFMRYEINVCIVAKFLFALAKAFNTFYYEVVVLVPSNAPHNFPGMMARVYLMKTICTVFENCLDILQINHADTPLLYENESMFA